MSNFCYQPILVGLSVWGAWAVTVPEMMKYGFAAWLVGNAGWVIHFISKKEWFPAGLFTIYWLLAIKGVLGA